MAQTSSFISRFGELLVGGCTVRPSLNEIEGSGTVVRVEPKAMEVLLHLIEHAGKVRSKRRIIEAVWGGAFVTDEVLTHAIWQLRRAFGDDASDPHYIETIPRRGYRLLASLSRWEEAPSSAISHYKILEKLGGGGMGVVYKAEDTRLSRPVALKFLAPELSRNPEAVERFEREARAASALSHASICTIYDIGEEEGQRFLAMEFLEGQTLASHIAGRPLPGERILDLAVEIVDALATAHAHSILHRDLKPANLFVTTGGHAKILDFGLAKLTATPDAKSAPDAPPATSNGDPELTRPGGVLGTIAYMSPEQARGQVLDGRSDLFSLGAVLYEMATGEPAFNGSSSQEIHEAILHRDPVPPGEINPELPPELAAIIEKLLRKTPDQRYPSAAELLAKLVELRQHAGEASRPISEERKGIRFRRTSLTAALAAALVASLAGSLVWWQLRRPPALERREPILLSEFVNTTGDPVFDHTLDQALAIKLRESPFFDVVAEQRVQETLRLMQRPPGEPITLGLAREICQRQRVKAVLSGTIAPFGSGYVLTLHAEECGSGELLAGEQIEAKSKEEVLLALDRGSSRLRRELGESWRSIERYDTPIEAATTSSLEALKPTALDSTFSVGSSAAKTPSPTTAAPSRSTPTSPPPTRL